MIVFAGTLINIGLQKNLRLFDWLHVTQKKTLATAININRATVEDLLKVPGVGFKTAEFILEYRHTKGSFTSLEPLRQARGMSPQRYERLIKYFKL
ncbi:MAG: helix-hairpin-helix domain-containing protein [Candidatus Omnitrophica bacterium]|nr:helix-hairpin-helix domain-containing protein [Candidatus Omnitrophota bacterium]